MRHRRGAAAAALLLAGSMLLAACGPAPARPSDGPTAGPSVAPTAGSAAASTRAAIQQALGARGVLLDDPQRPYRPAEAPLLSTVPRAVHQAVLPADPAHGFIVVYELGDVRSAQEAARAQADYVGSPVGRVQFPTGTQFVVRQLGRTVVFYADPPDSPDQGAAAVVEALRTVGSEVTVPS